MSIQSIHRTLNKARKYPKKFYWILSNPTNKAKTFTAGTKGKKVKEMPSEGAFMIFHFELQVNQTTAGKINRGEQSRDVCAAARGIVKKCPVQPELRNPEKCITINMIKKGKEDKITRGTGKGENSFVFAHNRKKCPKKGRAIYGDSTGMYIVD